MKITIIGAGNMGGAIARGLLKSQATPTQNICISDKSHTALNQLREVSDKWKLTTSNTEAIESANIIVLAVKPWLVQNVAEEIKDFIDYSKQLIVSVAAKVEISTLKKHFRSDATLFRLIPNTAIEFLESVNTFAYAAANEEQIKQLNDIFSKTGKCFFVEENQIDAFMSLSSCGIAYAFRYIRAAMQGGTEIGIKPNIAKEVAIQTLKGAISVLEKSNNHPEVEIDKVTTPGGITIKGLNEMEKNGFSNAIIQGIKTSI